MQSITPLHRCKTTTKKYNLQKEKTQKESAKKRHHTKFENNNSQKETQKL